tara:strand:- start:670 stop:834 length:165 start_codon:yes stop_codon:yes gene_type:complete
MCLLTTQELCAFAYAFERAVSKYLNISSRCPKQTDSIEKVSDILVAPKSKAEND